MYKRQIQRPKPAHDDALPAGNGIRSKDVVSKLFSDVAGRFKDRQGGYTRMVKTRRRIGDGAEMVAIELVTMVEKASSKAAALPAATTPVVSPEASA